MNRGGKMLNRGGKYLRPPPSDSESSEHVSSDDEEDDEEQDEVHDDTNRKETLTPPSTNLSSSSDDDYDDGIENNDKDGGNRDNGNDDENGSDDFLPSSRKHKHNGNTDDDEEEDTQPKKKLKASKYFDEYAEASDNDDIEEPYGTHHDPHDIVKKHYTTKDIERENMDEEARAIIRQQNERRKRTSEFSHEADVADIAKQIEERHRMSHRRVDHTVLDIANEEGEGSGQNLSAVTQQSLLPSVSDPSLWMFSCANGKEEDLVYQIMNKCIAFARQGKPLGITGAVAAQSKGKIYIESTSEPFVMEAVQGIRGLLTYTMKLVPISNMTTVLNVTPKKKPVTKGEWVRLTRGHFKGDLALVRLVRESGLKCVIQCVPRIDLTLSDLTPEEARVRRRTVRPPQNFFNPQGMAAQGKHIQRQQFKAMGRMPCDFFEGNYYHDGYLLKEVSVGTMVKQCSDEDPPTLDELQRFRNRNNASSNDYDRDGDEENEGSKMAKSLLDELSDLQGQTKLTKDVSNTGGLFIGDNVEIIEGDLVGMRGKLLSIDGSTVKVKPTNTDDLGGTAEVEFLVSQVKKYIEVGAHVKVSSGRYANETGVVVAVSQVDGENDSSVTVLTDITNKERSVRMSQLQESTEVASGLEKLGGFELHDLVVLIGGGSMNEVGVIVRVGREDFTVINNHGICREVRPEGVRGKRNLSSNRAVALDAQGNQIRVGDSVSVVEGQHKGKSATIKRVSRTQLFLYSQTRIENAGIFVVRSRSCVLSGSGSQSRTLASGGASPFNAQQSRQGGGGPAGRGKKEDGLFGKSVRIQAGNWKGYIGTVCDTTPTHVQVELHTRLKKVMVVRDRVTVAGDKFGATEDSDRINPNTSFTASTPFIGGATPMHGGATPMHDGMSGAFTPSHNRSDTDDVWRPGGNIDRSVDDVANASVESSYAWGATEDSNSMQQQTEAFTSSEAEAAGGWGSSNDQDGGTWTPSTTEKSQAQEPSSLPSAPSINRYGNLRNTTEKQVSATDMHSSAMGSENNEETPVWFMERVCVQIKKNDVSAVIKEVDNSTAVVQLEDETRITVSHNDVTMVAPKEHDTVLVTGGADVGVEAELVCIDGDTDAILKDSNEEFKIVEIGHLAKIVSDV